MKLFRNILLFLLLIPCVVIPQRMAVDGNEYNLKALFIFNFIKYVDWPQMSETGTFKIVVLGQSDIIESLKKISEQKKINNQKIEITESDDPEEINAQVLFIPRDMSDRL